MEWLDIWRRIGSRSRFMKARALARRLSDGWILGRYRSQSKNMKRSTHCGCQARGMMDIRDQVGALLEKTPGLPSTLNSRAFALFWSSGCRPAKSDFLLCTEKWEAKTIRWPRVFSCRQEYKLAQYFSNRSLPGYLSTFKQKELVFYGKEKTRDIYLRHTTCL